MGFAKINFKRLFQRDMMHKLSMGFMLLLLAFLPHFVSAQNREISGTVKDSAGISIPDVSIRIRNGKPLGVTDDQGYFKLSVPVGTTLIFSSISFQEATINVSEQNTYTVLMHAKKGELNEVVVVGYGTQKKVNMTGSVATIGAKQIANRPVTNISSALGGIAPGVSVAQTSGRPGSDGATIRIRGIGTLNNAGALIVVDGIIGSMDAVNPNDVASISILKDAAAASIYGAQAANGVILITTKKGTKGKPKFVYTGMFSQSRPNNVPKFITDYARYMQLMNQGAVNVGQVGPYPQSDIDTWNNAKLDPNKLNSFGYPNYVVYSNTNWGDEIFEHNLIQNHNFQVTGGSDNVSYNLSARYLGNPGIMHNTGQKRYEIRANLEVKASEFLTLGTQTFASTETFGKGAVDNLFNFLRQTNPGIYPYYNGIYGAATSTVESGGLNNLLLYLYGSGGNNQVTRLNSTLYATINFLKNLSLTSRINYQVRQQETTDYTNPIDRYSFATNQVLVPSTPPANLTTSQGFNKDYTYTFDNVLRYNNQWRKHGFSALAGYNEYYYNYYTFSATKTGLIDGSITNIGTATTMTTIDGNRYDRSMRSFFGRLNYNYDEKYLFEANFRRDASSRFGTNNKWGSFPSFSAAWRISEESFFQNLKNTFQDVKLRGSWGKLGNDAIANIKTISPSSDVKKSKYIAEMKFLRAYFYFRLNQLFKGVPIYLEPRDQKDLLRPRNTEAEVWTQVLTDLTDAINEPNLPLKYASTDANFGHATKGAAYALRGKAYIYQNNWTSAIADFKSVKDAGYALFSGNYRNLFLEANEKSDECIFSIQYLPVDGYGSNTQFFCGTRSSFGSCWNTYVVSPYLVDNYENKDGSPFNWDSYIPGYSSKTNAQREAYFLRDNLTDAEKAAAAARGADMSVYLQTGNEARIAAVYANRDPRLTANVITPYSTYLGRNINGVDQTFTMRWPVRNELPPTLDLLTDTRTYMYYLHRKFVYTGSTQLPNRTSGGIDFPIMRYAEVLLLWAEALNESGNTNDAVALVNQIRARAGVGLLNSSAATTVAGQADLRKRIRHERLVEFPNEGISFFDEMRWKTWKEDVFFTGNGIRQVWGSVTVPYIWLGDQLYNWPIPLTERQNNPSLTQNPGWID